MNSSDIFDEKISLLGVKADTSDQVIHILGNLLLTEGYVKESYIQSVIDREKVFSTGLSLSKVNIALPHTDAAHVYHQGIAVGVLETPVDFHVMGNSGLIVPVSLVFLMAIQENDDQIKLLQMLGTGLQNTEFVDSLLCSQSLPEIIKKLHSWFKD